MVKSWEELGEMVRARREQLGRTQEDVVDVANRQLGPKSLSTQTLRKFEQAGQDSYRTKSLAAIAAGLDWPRNAIQELQLGADPKTLPTVVEPYLEPTDRLTQDLAFRRSMAPDWQPDIIFELDDKTKVVVEVKGGGKEREAQVIGRLRQALFENAQWLANGSRLLNEEGAADGKVIDMLSSLARMVSDEVSAEDIKRAYEEISTREHGAEVAEAAVTGRGAAAAARRRRPGNVAVGQDEP